MAQVVSCQTFFVYCTINRMQNSCIFPRIDNVDNRKRSCLPKLFEGNWLLLLKESQKWRLYLKSVENS